MNSKFRGAQNQIESLKGKLNKIENSEALLNIFSKINNLWLLSVDSKSFFSYWSRWPTSLCPSKTTVHRPLPGHWNILAKFSVFSLNLPPFRVYSLSPNSCTLPFGKWKLSHFKAYFNSHLLSELQGKTLFSIQEFIQ